MKVMCQWKCWRVWPKLSWTFKVGMLAETELKFSPRNHATKKKESAADQHSVCKILWQRSSELSNYRRFKFGIGQIDLTNMNTNDEFKSSFSSRERYSEPAHLKDWSSSEAIKTRNQASRPRLKSEKYYLVQHFGRWPVDVVSIWHHGGDNCGSLILRSYKSKPSKMDNSFWQCTLLLTKCVTKDWPKVLQCCNANESFIHELKSTWESSCLTRIST